MDLARDRHAVLRLGIVDRVSTDDHETAGRRDVLAAGEELAEEFGRQLVAVPTDEVEREERSSSHRVDVGDAVRGGDTSPRARIVDHRCDEVSRRDERSVVVQLPDRSVVAGVGADEQLIGVFRFQMAHDVRQLARSELAASTGPVTELGEPDAISFAHLLTLRAKRDTPYPVDRHAGPDPVCRRHAGPDPACRQMS